MKTKRRYVSANHLRALADGFRPKTLIREVDMTIEEFNAHLSAYGIAYRNWYTAANYADLEKARARVVKGFQDILSENESLKEKIDELRLQPHFKP